MPVSKSRQIAAGAFALIAWVGAIFLLAPESAPVGTRADVRIVEPAVGTVLNVAPNGDVYVGWTQANERESAELDWTELEASERVECDTEEQTGTRAVGERQDSEIERVCWAAPDRNGIHLMGADVVVGAERIGRRARLVRVADDTNDERVQVAVAHVAAAEIEEQLNTELPARLNLVLASLLPTLSNQIEARSRDWRIPGWLVDGVRLGSQSSVVVSSARVELRPEGLAIAMNIHVDLRVEVLNRPVIAPRRRGTRVIDFRIRDNFAPARFRLGMSEWPQVRVHDAQLRGDYCERVQRDLFRDVCDRVTNAVYSRLEREIEERVGDYASQALASLELDSLITAAVVTWAEDIELGAQTRELLADAELGVAEIVQDETGAHFAVEVRRDWLRTHFGPSDLALVDDPERSIDLAISMALVDRVLQELFERPLVDVVAMFDSLATDEHEQAPSEILRMWLNPHNASAGGELTQFLRLVGLELRPDVAILPWIDINARDEIVLTVHDARLFRAADQEGPSRTLSTSVEAKAAIAPCREGWCFVVEPRAALRTLAVEAAVAGATTESRRYRRQLEAAVRQLYKRLGKELEPGDDEAGARRLVGLLQGLVDDLPAMPSTIETPGLRLLVEHVGLNGEQRTIEVGADFELR